MRVKYYGPLDPSLGPFLSDAASLADKFNPARTTYAINDILELFNVASFLDHPSLREQASGHGVTYGELKPVMVNTVFKYFGAFTGRNVAKRASGIEREYIDDFLTLFAKTRLSRVISPVQMKNLLVRNSVPLSSLLQQKGLVREYQDLIKRLLLSDQGNAAILLSHYFSAQTAQDPTLHLPANLTAEETTKLVESYVDSPSPNLNYLRLIVESRDSEEFRLPDELRLKARRRFDSETKTLLEQETSGGTRYIVAFDDSQQNDRIDRYDGRTCEVSFRKAWFAENLDYPTILNNFLHLFDFVDAHMMLTMPSFKAEMGAIERVIGLPSKTSYQTGIAFNSKAQIARLELSLYRTFLNDREIRLEHVMEWFFSTYLPQEFGANDFHVELPSDQSTYVEKCALIFPEMESALKQFHYFTRDGRVDQDLVRLSTQPVDYRTIPSLIADKYAYAVTENQDVTQLLQALFSDQSGLGYIRQDLQAPTLYDLIRSAHVRVSDLHEYQRPAISWLQKQRILQVGDGRLVFDNLPKVHILRLLNFREAVNIGRLQPDMQKAVRRMQALGQVEFESTLLSRPEATYFDYHLNARSFGNGLNLKNIYSHGTRPVGANGDDRIYYQHYLVGLILLLLLLIKINDEFDMRWSDDTSKV